MYKATPTRSIAEEPTPGSGRSHPHVISCMPAQPSSHVVFAPSGSCRSFQRTANPRLANVKIICRFAGLDLTNPLTLGLGFAFAKPRQAFFTGFKFSFRLLSNIAPLGTSWHTIEV